MARSSKISSGQSSRTQRTLRGLECRGRLCGRRGRRRVRVWPSCRAGGHTAQGPLGSQIDSRSALAAACRRSLTSASSRAAISMRSCCASERSCWRSARCCWLSARSLLALSRSSIAATVRVRSATCAAMLAMSSSDVTPCRSLRREPRVSARPLAWEGLRLQTFPGRRPSPPRPLMKCRRGGGRPTRSGGSRAWPTAMLRRWTACSAGSS